MYLNKLAENFSFDYYILRMYAYLYIDDKKITPHDMKFFYPFEDIKSEGLSLTDGISPDDQIRFFLKDRVIRKINEVAKRISIFHIDPVVIDIRHVSSPMIQYLIEALNRMKCAVVLKNNLTLSQGAELTVNEKKLIKELAKNKNGSVRFIEQQVRKIVNGGDIFTAERILEHGIRVFSDFETENAYLIGIVKNCLEKPIEAEYYYNLNKQDGNPQHIVTSNYTLSMLYLRHHKPNKLNFDKGKALLNEAYDTIKSGGITHLDKDEQNFYEVFNRNGYGLVLFREGLVYEAIDLLKWGINTLSADSAKHHMHKSVILYNISQCYKRTGDFKSAIECYDELIRLDPEFPEYHLELGLCMSEQGKAEEWKRCILKSLEVSPYHSDSHYFYSLYNYEQDNIELAEHHARLAWELSGSDLTAYNLAFIESLKNDYTDLTELMPQHHSSSLADWYILLAEKNSYTSKSAAEDTLKVASELFADHDAIKENLAYLEDEKV